MPTTTNGLALFGRPRAVQQEPGDLFTWPIVTPEDEAAVLAVLREGAMSGSGVTQQFEQEFAAWQGRKYALGFNNGTAALHAAMFACGVGVGDEILCPAMTYWASALPCLSLGATVVFTDIDPITLCIDPGDIEHRITSRTKAIVVVHYLGHPADMESILQIACRHHVKVIEDFSHAQGGLYRGRRLGTFGEIAATSLMSGKSLAAGEAGMLVTDDRELLERATALGHYERFTPDFQTEALRPYAGLPMGGYKYRMHQLSAAMGRVQLKSYDARCAEIRRAMNRFWDSLEGVAGIRAHRVDEGTGSNMAGWYAPHGLYRPDELGGLSLRRFCEAVRAEGCPCHPGGNFPLHLHPLLQTCDVYGHGRPTRLANVPCDIREALGSLPVTERINRLIYTVPWFKHDRPTMIAEYAHAFRKVAQNYRELLTDDPGDGDLVGRSGLSARR